MGFNLFQNTEQKLKETMFHANSPVASDIKMMFESEASSIVNPLYMGVYDPITMNKRPQHEQYFLKNILTNRQVGLVLFEDSGLFFANLKEVLRFKNDLLVAVEMEEESGEYRHAWISLMRFFWDNKIPIANMRNFIEGYELLTFVNGQKVKKDFFERPPWPLR